MYKDFNDYEDDLTLRYYIKEVFLKHKNEYQAFNKMVEELHDFIFDSNGNYKEGFEKYYYYLSGLYDATR